MFRREFPIRGCLLEGGADGFFDSSDVIGGMLAGEVRVIGIEDDARLPVASIIQTADANSRPSRTSTISCRTELVP